MPVLGLAGADMVRLRTAVIGADAGKALRGGWVEAVVDDGGARSVTPALVDDWVPVQLRVGLDEMGAVVSLGVHRPDFEADPRKDGAEVDDGSGREVVRLLL